LQFITFSDLNTTYFIKACERPKTFKIPTAKKMPVDKPKTHSVSESIVRKPIMRSIIETFSVPIKKVRFKYHCVSFDYTFKDYYKTIELTISNPDIIEEFDAIKNYFANVLKTKNIQVIANIEIVDDNIVSTEVNSPEISKIDEQIIDAVKHEFIKSTIKKKSNGKIEKSSFTMDEYFDAFADEGIKPNTFYNNDKEFFEDLLKIVNTKHYKHLRYLSSKHSHDIMKLRFVHEPFSFIFLITGVENYYIIWETLDTQEATYVWQITKNIKQLKMTILKIEEIICKIKVQGKMPYLKSREDSLIRVFHDYSDNVGGFVKWKGEIESKLK